MVKSLEKPTLVDLLRALEFAARKHQSHRRKGAAREPYVNHLAEVTRLLAEATGGRDVVLLMGGLLHDTIEDTETSEPELAHHFGEEVAQLVAEVTDDKSLEKQQRKRLQIEHAAQASRRAKMIKLADKISNVRALASSPPQNWDSARKRAYVEWAKAVVDRCRGVSPELESLFDQTVAIFD